jgi:hypothetical protein
MIQIMGGAYYLHGAPGGKVSLLEGHSIGHSKKKSLYEHVSYSEHFPIFGAQYFEFGGQNVPIVMLYCLKHVNRCEASVGCCDCC